MPKRGSSASAKVSTPRRQKVDPIYQLCTKVERAIQEGEDVPASAKRMLLDMLHPALAVEQDLRHKYQAEVVAMVGELLAASEKRLLAAQATAEAAVAGDDGEKKSIEEAINEADARLKEKQLDARQKKYTLADHATAFRAAKEAVQLAQLAVSSHEQELEATRQQKASLEAMMAEQAEPLINGTATPAEAVGMVSRLIEVLQKLGVDEGMISALPNALAKVPTERGAFDAVVINSLRETVGNHVAALEAAAQESEPKRAEKVAALASAEEILKKATAAQQVSAEVFVAARDEETNLVSALAERQQDLKTKNADAKSHVKALNAAKKQLDAFQSGPLASFTELRDRRTPPSEEPKPDVAMDVEVAAEEPAEPVAAV